MPGLAEVIKDAVVHYQDDVKRGDFPTEANGFPLDLEVLKGLD